MFVERFFYMRMCYVVKELFARDIEFDVHCCFIVRILSLIPVPDCLFFLFYHILSEGLYASQDFVEPRVFNIPKSLFLLEKTIMK